MNIVQRLEAEESEKVMRAEAEAAELAEMQVADRRAAAWSRNHQLVAAR